MHPAPIYPLVFSQICVLVFFILFYTHTCVCVCVCVYKLLHLYINYMCIILLANQLGTFSILSLPVVFCLGLRPMRFPYYRLACHPRSGLFLASILMILHRYIISDIHGLTATSCSSGFYILPAPLPPWSLSLRYRNYVVDLPVLTENAWSLVLCILVPCGFL